MPDRLAVDTGGTFTDCVAAEEEGVRLFKLPSTPHNPGEAVLLAVDHLAPRAPFDLRHGTTVGTNALLERKGARVAFLTTAGFEDTVAIGRQARPHLYDLAPSRELPLAGEELRLGVRERVGSDGGVVLPLDSQEINRVRAAVAGLAPEAVAVSLLFSFANPEHERRLADALRTLDIPVSVSHEILPEFREYERASTVLVNAYLAPVMLRYLGSLAAALEHRGGLLRVMQSSGGLLPAHAAMAEPVRTVLSGPAGGVTGALAVASSCGFDRILTFDMGGTSTDVALLDRQAGLHITKESLAGGFPVAIPMLPIHTAGAGGGSLAVWDSGGALQVGPGSAGADPGPICYGRGARPTVTDANLLLGRIHPERFLGGGMRLDLLRARDVFEHEKQSLPSVEAYAEGIVRVIDSHMERALRQISVEQGRDPREFVLVSFGGAGPLHAVSLARALDIPQVLIPNFPGALSAYGALVADWIRDYSRTVMLRAAPNQAVGDSLDEHFRALEERATTEMSIERLAGTLLRSLDLRYRGQGYELTVPSSADAIEAFHQLHESRYGYADRRREIEIVNLRLRATASSAHVPARVAETGTSSLRETAGPVDHRIYWDGHWHRGKLYDRARLSPGSTIPGPAVIAEYSATTFLPPETVAYVDEAGNLLISLSS